MPAQFASPLSLRQVRRLHSRKERRLSGRFFAEGIRAVRAAMESPCSIEVVFHTSAVLRNGTARDIIDLAYARHIPCVPLTDAEFNSISTRDNPRGVACVGKLRWMTLEDLASPEAPVLALHAPQDPGNLGTIIRTSDAVGCAGIILIGDAVDPWHPSALRAAMGATFSIPLIAIDIPEFIAWVRAHPDLPVLGTSDKAPDDYATHPFGQRFVLMMGSEREGLPSELIAIASTMLRIPMAGSIDSLNLSIATALVLYQAVNQRRLTSMNR